MSGFPTLCKMRPCGLQPMKMFHCWLLLQAPSSRLYRRTTQSKHTRMAGPFPWLVLRWHKSARPGGSKIEIVVVCWVSPRCRWRHYDRCCLRLEMSYERLGLSPITVESLLGPQAPAHLGIQPFWSYLPHSWLNFCYLVPAQKYDNFWNTQNYKNDVH